MPHSHTRRAMAVAACALLSLVAPLAVAADDSPAPATNDKSSRDKGRKDAEWWNAAEDSKVDSLGAFSDAIPIDVPEFHSITPAIGLSYRSSGGNGSVGVGWSLSGTSLVESASPGKGSPSYDASDIFLLDGEELVPCASESVSPSCTTGGTHSTKTESYRRIARSGTGASSLWTITDKSGTKRIYGPVYSLPGADGAVGTSDDNVYRWGLKKVVDTTNNVVSYTWGTNLFSGAWEYIDSISYNGTTIKFYYQQRSDIETSAIGSGQRQRVTGRLQTIDIAVSGDRVRAYKLSYDASEATNRSLLTSVQQFGRNATLDTSGTVTGGTSLPAITAGYPAATAASFESGTSDTGMGSNPDQRYLTLDVNGDGKADMLDIWKICALSCTYKGAVWLTDGSGFTKASEFNVPGFTKTAQYLVMDIDGDGRDDFLSLTNNGNGKWRRSIFVSNGTGFTVGATDTSMAYEVDSQDDGEPDNDVVLSHFLPMDINGDGKTDLLEIYPRQECTLLVFCDTKYSRVAWISTGSGFTKASEKTSMIFSTKSRFFPADFNGDGKWEFIELTAGDWNTLELRPHITDGESFTALGLAASSTYDSTSQFLAMDIDGDGKTDLYERLPEGIGSRRKVWLSTGDDFALGSSTWTSEPISSSARYVTGDFNADGKSDFALMTPVLLSVKRAILLSTGKDFAVSTTDSLGNQADHKYLGADVDGDGRTDMVELSSRLGKTTRRSWLTTGPTPDLLVSLGNGLGGTTTVSYTPSSVWANTNNPSIVQTATSVTVADGRGGSATTSYRFSGGKYDAENRRFLGFAYRKETLPCIAGEASCPYNETWFLQGNDGAATSPSRADQRDGAGRLFRSELFEYTTNGSTLPWTALATGRWVHMYAGDNAGTNCPGTDCKRRYRSRAFNAYGEVTQEVEYGDYDVSGDERTMTTLYVPNTTKFIVDQPADVKIFQGVGTGGTLLNEALSYYDGATTWNQAPSAGLATKEANWLSSPNGFVTTQRTYDSWGNVIAATNEVGAVTTFEIDPTYHLFPTSTTNALEQATTTTWDPVCGEPSQTTNVNGQATTLTYDNLCRLVTKTEPGGKFETHSWVSLGNPTAQYEQVNAPAADGTGNSLWRRRYFDGLERTWRTMSKGPDSATGNVYEDTAYNARGKVASKTAPFYYVSGASATKYTTTFSYDAIDRQVRATHPDSTYRTTSYELWSVTETDELGRSTTDRFNAYGRRVAHDEVVGGVTKTTTYVYDARQNLQKATDPSGNVTTTQTTDSLGRVTKQVDLDWGTSTFEFDGAGRLTAKTDAKNQRTTYRYDALDRKIGKTTNAETEQPVTVSWTYDQARSGYYNVGSLTTMTDAAGTKKLDHDLGGRIVKTVRTINGTSYTTRHGYDAGGRILWTTYPDGDTLGTSAAPLLYDSAGRLKSIPGYVTSAAYNADGNVTRIDNGNGTSTTRTYSAQRGWLTGVETTNGTTNIQDLGFTRNAKGMVTRVTSPVANEGWTYAYDDLDRLTTATNASSATYTQTLAYDALGNITTNSRVGSYGYHPTKKHAVTTAGPNSYAYDTNGLMISGAGRTLTWDGDNRVATVTTGGSTATMTYDADGARIAQVIGSSVHHYLGDDYEIEEGGWTTKHVSVGGILVATKSGTTKLWIHTDHLGSIQAETDTSGVVVYRKKYRPYGEILSASGTQDYEVRGYTAQRHDESGLLYLHARFYDPTLGRFISPDDIIDGPNTVGLNRYAYTANDPVNNTDISGHCSTAADRKRQAAGRGPCREAGNGPVKDPVADLAKAVVKGGVALGAGALAGRGAGPVAPWVQHTVSGAVWEGLDELDDRSAAPSAWEVAAGREPAPRIYPNGLRGTGSYTAQAAANAASLRSWSNLALLDNHFRRHGGDFSAKSEEQYTRMATNFIRRGGSRDGLQIKVDEQGIVRVFEQETNTFGSYNPDGTTRTYFKPTSPDYWSRQPGESR